MQTFVSFRKPSYFQSLEEKKEEANLPFLPNHTGKDKLNDANFVCWPLVMQNEISTIPKVMMNIDILEYMSNIKQIYKCKVMSKLP